MVVAASGRGHHVITPEVAVRAFLARLREASWPGLVLVAITAIITVLTIAMDARNG